MAKKRFRGTDRLFEKASAITEVLGQHQDGAVQQHIAIQRIVPNRYNPRQFYSRDTLEELIKSMEGYGFIGALDGRALEDGRVELAYGSRRLLAAKAAGLPSIPIFLHDWDDSQMRVIALVENLAREDLTPVDEANTVGQLHELGQLSTREISQRIGKPRSWVQDRLALYEAPEDVREMVLARPDSLRAARFIARLPDAESRRLVRERILNQELTTRQVQQLVQRVEEGMPIGEALASLAAPPAPRRTAPSSRSKREETPHVLSTVAEPLDEERHDSGAIPLTTTGSEAPPAVQVFEQEVPYSATLTTLQRPGMLPRAATDTQPSDMGQLSVSADRGWPSSGVPLIVLACEALDGFDPGTLSNDEAAEAIEWLRHLIDGVGTLIEILERRR